MITRAEQQEKHNEILAMAKRASESMKHVEALVAKGMPLMQAIIVSGDMHSAELADARVAAGTPPIRCLVYIGSYARFEWAVKNLSIGELIPLLPELWREADPDDTNPKYLELWRTAFRVNGNKIVCDGRQPPGGQLLVHRGQVGTARGFSWTTDRLVAEKFSRCGGQRLVVSGGRVLTKRVPRSQVLAFITNRDESEVILNIDI